LIFNNDDLELNLDAISVQTGLILALSPILELFLTHFRVKQKIYS